MKNVRRFLVVNGQIFFNFDEAFWKNKATQTLFFPLDDNMGAKVFAGYRNDKGTFYVEVDDLSEQYQDTLTEKYPLFVLKLQRMFEFQKDFVSSINCIAEKMEKADLRPKK